MRVSLWGGEISDLGTECSVEEGWGCAFPSSPKVGPLHWERLRAGRSWGSWPFWMIPTRRREKEGCKVAPRNQWTSDLSSGVLGPLPLFFLVSLTWCPFLLIFLEMRGMLLTYWGRNSGMDIQDAIFPKSCCTHLSQLNLLPRCNRARHEGPFPTSLWLEENTHCPWSVVFCSVLPLRLVMSDGLLGHEPFCPLHLGISPCCPGSNTSIFLPLPGVYSGTIVWWLGTAKWVSSCSLVTSSQKVFQNVDVVSRVIFQAS